MKFPSKYPGANIVPKKGRKSQTAPRQEPQGPKPAPGRGVVRVGLESQPNLGSSSRSDLYNKLCCYRELDLPCLPYNGLLSFGSGSNRQSQKLPLQYRWRRIPFLCQRSQKCWMRGTQNAADPGSRCRLPLTWDWSCVCLLDIRRKWFLNDVQPSDVFVILLLGLKRPDLPEKPARSTTYSATFPQTL